MTKFIFRVVCLVLLSSSVLADPIGRYAVSGANPGNESPYNGTVDVQQTGETYRVVWMINGQRYVGTGIGDDKFIAVSYRSGSETGLALYYAEGDDWVGVWTYANGTRIGVEKWARR